MKKFIFSILVTLQIGFACQAQVTDTALAKKLTINKICLCNATIDNLKLTDMSLKEVDVEEMDIAKGCFGEDSRFIAGKGYASKLNPGMIFQKDQQSDLVSKIRLTKQFKGYLPDGKFIDLSALLLKDLFVLFPTLKDKWGSRGCSNYWHFSNDTIAFFVKIDDAKKAEFPVDEAYFMDKPVEAADFVFSCSSTKMTNSSVVSEYESNEPMYYIDSIRVNRRVLSNYNPDEIAIVTVFKEQSAIKLKGQAAKNGLIYIETKSFAKHRYIKNISLKSADYARLIKHGDDDSDIQYILNNKVLKDNFEGDLASINLNNIINVEILSHIQLTTQYHINNKEYGVIITSKVQPKTTQPPSSQ